jgi:hypothetical protein
MTSMADQANSADKFANAGNDMDDDEEDEEEIKPATKAQVQTKSVTDLDNYKVFKYRLEHEPQNVANTL